MTMEALGMVEPEPDPEPLPKRKRAWPQEYADDWQLGQRQYEAYLDRLGEGA